MPSSAYELTLSTVWNLAFRRLSNDSKQLLESLAFLNPGQAPVEVFVGLEKAPQNGNIGNWKGLERWLIASSLMLINDRFDAAIGILLE